MTARQRLLKRWLLGYLLLLFASLPLALPCWNAFLSARVGRWLTIEAIHLLQYMGLGAIAACYAHAAPAPWPTRARLAGLILAVGLADELLQIVLPQRVFDWKDVWLNWLGGLAAMAFGGTGAWVRRRLTSPSQASMMEPPSPTWPRR